MDTYDKATANVKIANSAVVIFIFISVNLFQLTTFKFIWNIEILARLVNLVILIGSSVYFLHALVSSKFNKKVYFYYILPGLMIYFGYFINLSINSISNISVVNQFGLLLPWAIYLTIPKLMKREVLNSNNLWRYYYYFMLAAVVLSIVEYALVFYGKLNLRLIETSGGGFLAAWFSIFHNLEDGSAYYRIYACFHEPGTLAMYLLPAMAYAFFNKIKISFVLFCVALFLTNSLGGYISLFIFLFIAIYMFFSKKLLSQLIILLLLFSIAVMLFIGFSEEFLSIYEQKQNSRIERESNLANFIYELPRLIINYPLGYTLSESTEKANLNEDYFGSTFALSNAFMLGGISSFIGYLAVLLVSISVSIKVLFRTNHSNEEKIVYLSLIVLLPFVIQRAAVWDGALFALLFAPVIIRSLQSDGIFEETR